MYKKIKIHYPDGRVETKKNITQNELCKYIREQGKDMTPEERRTKYVKIFIQET